MTKTKRAAIAVLLCASGLSGCATVFEGTSQEITVTTNPPDASCSFERQGSQIGTIGSTPGTANIRKSKYDITVKCDKPGYQQAQYLNHSGTTATIAANVAADLILTAGISSIVDSADGADNKYDSAVNLTLIPLGMVPPAPPAAAPAPAKTP
jgi:predicted small secreted protein